MNNSYNQNFLETPDPVTGLQRRTGQNFLDHKQTLHERLTLEHNFDVSDSIPQEKHGIHRAGSAMAYVTETDDPEPVDRPTGMDKGGTEITALPLDDEDRGRLWIKDENEFWFWKDETDGWVKIDTTPIGFLQTWASPHGSPPATWLKCDGTDTYVKDDYPALFALLGSTYGGDGITTFAVPNLQGISIVGAGQQDDFGVDDRTKGSNALVGEQVEDQIQTFTGNARAQIDEDYRNLFGDFDGIFSAVGDLGGSDQRTLTNKDNRRAGRQGFKIDLDNNMGTDIDPIHLRHGGETRASALAMDYYIKAL